MGQRECLYLYISICFNFLVDVKCRNNGIFVWIYDIFNLWVLRFVYKKVKLGRKYLFLATAELVFAFCLMYFVH